MTREDLENELKNAYDKGYDDKGVRNYDFHQHSYKLLDDFKSKTCEGCKHAEESDTGYDYYCTKHNEYENSYMSCDKWLQK